MEDQFHHPVFLNKKKEMREFYLTLFLRSMATKLMGVFGFVYLLTIGFSLNIVLLFLAVHLIAITPASPLVGKITQKFGIKHTVIAAPFISVIYYIMLYSLRLYPNNILLFSAAIIGAIGSTLFWIPMNSHFALNSDHKRIAKEVSYRTIMSKFPKVIGPLIASAIIVYLGFLTLFIVVALIYLACLIPILMTKDYMLPLKRKLNGFFSRKNSRYSIMFFVKGLYDVVGGTLLPLYIYLQTNSFVATGIIASLVGVGVLVGASIVGRIADRYGKHKIMRIAAVFTTIVWIAVFFSTGIWLYILSVLVGFGSMALSISVMAIYCQKLKPSMCEDYMIHREMWLGVGNGLIALVILGFLGLGFGFELAFIIAALSAGFFIFYRF